jgi:MoaA/NifB/PqqE/SkfB family radical SAM enzyme
VNQTVVDPEGVEHYKLLRSELAQLDVRVHLILAYSSSATYSTHAEIDLAPQEIGAFDTFGDFTDEKLRELFDEFASDLHSFGWKERVAKQYYLDGIRNRLLHNHASPNPPCVALSSHLRLFPNGDVPTCQMNSKVVGNLSRDSFESVWFGTEALEQREWVRGCPGCWAECEIIPSSILSGDILLPDLFRREGRSVSQGVSERNINTDSESQSSENPPQVYQVTKSPRLSD